MVGESTVPLDRNIVPDVPREFFPSFKEWVADGNAEQIVETIGTTNTTTSMYTVPENYTLFITSASISIRCTSGAPSARSAYIKLPQGNPLLICNLVGGNDQSVTSISFPMPIRAVSGDVTVTVSANAFANLSFTGFLLPKKISIR